MPQPAEFSFAALPDWVKLSGNFADSCRLILTQDCLKAGVSGAFALKIGKEGGNSPVQHVTVTLWATSGVFAINLNANHATVDIGAGCSGWLVARLWRSAALIVGEKTTFNGVRIVVENAKVSIGRDCMFSDDILIQSSDQHGIIDAQTLQVTNAGPRNTELADHVWVGRRATIMPDVTIGFGAIVGAGAIVTIDVPPMSVAAGVPARIVRSETTWSRNPQGLTPRETAMIKRFRELVQN